MAAYKIHAIGRDYEDKALLFLQDKGFRLLERNFRCKVGEIDLVMKDQEDVVFVEVRGRGNIDYGHALLSITPSKINKLIRAATYYLMQKKWLYTINSRFDVVAFTPDDTGDKIDWIKNAFLVNGS